MCRDGAAAARARHASRAATADGSTAWRTSASCVTPSGVSVAVSLTRRALGRRGLRLRWLRPRGPRTHSAPQVSQRQRENALSAPAFRRMLSKTVASSGKASAEVRICWRSACYSTASVPSATRSSLSTYRLQFNRRFTFRDARAIVDYLHALGVTDATRRHLKAVPGSPHGYDIVDPTRLNPDIGTDDRLLGLGRRPSRHAAWAMSSTSCRTTWASRCRRTRGGSTCLENGPSFALRAVLRHRVASGERRARRQGADSDPRRSVRRGARSARSCGSRYRDGAFVVPYYDDVPADRAGYLRRRFSSGAPRAVGDRSSRRRRRTSCKVILAASVQPAAARRTRAPDHIAAARAREGSRQAPPRRADRVERRRSARSSTRASTDSTASPDQPRSFDPLDRLLNEQSYRLAHWRVASEEINYRRFFDVNQLAALRMEDPAVFDEVHRFAFELVRRAAPRPGLRIDHVDGLYAPADYLRRLQERLKPTSTLRDLRRLRCSVLHRRREDPRRRRAAARRTGRSPGPPATSSRRVVNNLFVDRRNERGARRDLYRRFIRDAA